MGKAQLNSFLLIALAATALALVRCGSAPVAAGSSDQGNARVLGKITDVQGQGIAGVQVVLVPADYNPVVGPVDTLGRADTTNALGEYVLDRVYEGTYNILAIHLVNRTRLMISAVSVSASAAVAVPSDSVRAPVSLSIAIPAGTPLYVCIIGTNLVFLVDSADRATGSITLDSVPAGAQPEFVFAAVTSTMPVFTSDTNCVLGTWVSPTYSNTLSVDSTIMYDNHPVYRFVFNTDTNYSASFGLNLTSFLQKPVWDVSSMTHLRFVYRGPVPSITVRLNLVDSLYKGWASGDGAPITGSDTTWKTMEIPTSEFGADLNLVKLNEIALNLGGYQGAADTFYIGHIEFIRYSSLP